MTKNLIARTLVAIVALSYTLSAAAEMVRYQARPGSKVTIHGTSTFHDWDATGHLIGGYMELDSSLPLDPAKAPAEGGKVNANVHSQIIVRSLKSENKKMDDVMHAALKQDKHPKIEYQLKELVQLPKKAGEPLAFEATGDLTVAGVTKTIKMPVTFEKVGDDRLKVAGKVDVKMSDFGVVVKPPVLALGLIKVGDEVKLAFEWITARANPVAQK